MDPHSPEHSPQFSLVRFRKYLQAILASTRTRGASAPRSNPPAARQHQPGGSSASNRSKEQFQQNRQWANIHGYRVAPRGRIRSEIIRAFDAAHR
ncbi:histone-like nucleoid-structuring protein Lsr2 [Rhodococcus sp. C3V]|uniref:Lsr2 family DNA-binding protein n=1 Tax=Rhodococcus sp. C3V TaxID=3034165 RepID=UPI0023E2C5EC|nr:histone-like nucleoid-structuring protein Lsr2 [Rhodococcus sp. C3V]MDF3320109.1 Lsr2 family protein [Rhodococcus sp. C3V]